MPSHSPEELRALIAAGGVGAISIDTSVFDRYGCNLESPTLSAVGSLAPHHLSLLMSDIVLGEVRNHLIRDGRAAVDSARKSLRMIEKSRRPVEGAIAAAAEHLQLDADLALEADERIERFLDLTKAEVLGASEWLDAGELVDRYITASAPFEVAGSKKSEFPDAIALIQLERWGLRRESHVLAISTDDDWRRFAAQASWITVVDDLPAALAMFQAVEDELVARVAAQLRPEAQSDIAAMVGASLERHVDNLVPRVEAHSFTQFEAEFVGAEVVRWTAVDPGEVRVISSTQEAVRLSFEVEVFIEAEAEFSFAHYDSVDRDYVPLGSAEVVRELALTVAFVAEVGRVEPENDVLSMVAEERRWIELDFGSVEPDLSRR